MPTFVSQRLHEDLGLDRIGEEAGPIRPMMELPVFRFAGSLSSWPDSPRIIAKDANRLIPVAVHHVPLVGGQGQERQHVAA